MRDFFNLCDQCQDAACLVVRVPVAGKRRFCGLVCYREAAEQERSTQESGREEI
jgi:hypothetical protein